MQLNYKYVIDWSHYRAGAASCKLLRNKYKTTSASRYKESKHFLIIMKQAVIGWQWSICTSFQTEITMQATYHLVHKRQAALGNIQPTVLKHCRNRTIHIPHNYYYHKIFKMQNCNS